MPCSQNVQKQMFPAVDSLMLDAVHSELIPGGVVCVVADTGIVLLQAYGYSSIFPDTLKMTTNTLFDLASMSKPIVAMTIVRLAAQGVLKLNEKVATYLPEFKGNATLVHLLTHTSGLPAYVSPVKLEKQYGVANEETLFEYICCCSPQFEAGDDYAYSCLNYITLQMVVERVTRRTLDVLAQELVFAPLEMSHTTYCPSAEWYSQVAPTERQTDGTVLCGVVHDPLARLCGGVSGNAGIFSTAEDLAILAMFLLHNAQTEEVRCLTIVPDSLMFSARTCGWAKKNQDVRYMGNLSSMETYGHTGYTGTSMLVDPQLGLAIILLTNRVHPCDKGNLNSLRADIADAVLMTFVGNDAIVLHNKE
ncbi:MAG: beta-lactamase family protein [Paludibacter sp.]|nr:beta-lactamase family protein [Bacteroidales bacterium]MCM1068303.1 beta-lactamase family protein [Prevotella sp.]MCM1354594.1 beta-lactamase family protein [Bacteroides sp.]MCM1442088.1 beta-lactamase family protein [Muribaculum sp.]MCM1482018.1 beta-lactamase family protein [Paludibacter sp.]